MILGETFCIRVWSDFMAYRNDYKYKETNSMADISLPNLTNEDIGLNNQYDQPKVDLPKPIHRKLNVLSPTISNLYQ